MRWDSPAAHTHSHCLTFNDTGRNTFDGQRSRFRIIADETMEDEFV